MGVYIKDLEVSKDWGRWDFSLFVEPDGTAYVEIYPSKERLDVVSVTAPHGRLIDADELMKHELQATLFPEGREKNIDIWTHAIAIGDVIGAETIIEAEE